MRNNLQKLSKVLLLAVLCAGSINLYGQSLVSADYGDSHAALMTYAHEDDRQEPGEAVQLASVLKEMETDYSINFAYDGQLLNDKYVSAGSLEEAKGEEVEEALKQILKPLDIKYTKVNKVYVLHEDENKVKPVERKVLNGNSLDSNDERLETLAKLSSRSAMMNLVTLVEKTISGKVTDENQEGLPGVNIVVKGTTIGTVSDVNGNYRLNAPDDATTLVFSSVGYTAEEIEIGGRSVINLEMVPDIQALSEVVVVGYGTQEKVNLTGAVGVADGEVLENRPIPNVGEGLQGVIPNLNVDIRNGDPAEPIDFNIRGYESINGGNPLVLVVVCLWI